MTNETKRAVELCDLEYLDKKIKELTEDSELRDIDALRGSVKGFCEIVYNWSNRIKSLIESTEKGVEVKLSTLDSGLINRYRCPHCNELQAMSRTSDRNECIYCHGKYFWPSEGIEGGG